MSKNIILILSAILVLVSYNSCEKESKPQASVLVCLENDTPVEGAIVTVYSSPNGSYIDPTTLTEDATQETNESGRVYFTFEEKCILTAKAEYETDKGVILKADGLLMLEEGETYERKLIVK